jgi:hypothetical protein
MIRFHALKYTTRDATQYRNAAVWTPPHPDKKCTVYGDDDTPL